MKTIVANLLLLAMSVTYFLLAYQAETITGVLGYIFGTLLFLALIMSTFTQAKKQHNA